MQFLIFLSFTINDFFLSFPFDRLRVLQWKIIHSNHTFNTFVSSSDLLPFSSEKFSASFLCHWYPHSHQCCCLHSICLVYVLSLVSLCPTTPTFDSFTYSTLTLLISAPRFFLDNYNDSFNQWWKKRRNTIESFYNQFTKGVIAFSEYNPDYSWNTWRIQHTIMNIYDWNGYRQWVEVKIDVVRCNVYQVCTLYSVFAHAFWVQLVAFPSIADPDRHHDKHFVYCIWYTFTIWFFYM